MKKLASFLLVLLMICSSLGAYAYNFPEPDWGALLSEKRSMVNEVDFELYTEGRVESAPYYWAKFEPRGGTYLGMIAENSDMINNVGAYLTYFTMEIGQDDIYYPANEIIRNSNAVVTVAYNLNSLDAVDYDAIRKSLNNLSAYNKPMLIRFGSEMNCSSLGDEPDLYVQVFRNVANMIHEYDNFAVVWSPNDLGALDRPFDYYYPGDEYVDWIGISSYMKMYFQGDKNTLEKESIYFMTGDYAWSTNSIKPVLEFMQKNNINKPVMISEGGVATENIYGDDCTAWAIPRLRNMYWNLIMKYPQVKLINYFNTYRDEPERFYIFDHNTSGTTDKPYAIDIINEAAASGAYISGYGQSPEFVFSRADAGETLAAKNGIINLYTLAYIPKKPNITVNYYIDGSWYHSSSYAPYTFMLDINTISDGEHTIEISSEDQSKKYTFYKRGNAIRFGAEPDVPVVNTVSTSFGASVSPWAQSEIELAYQNGLVPDNMLSYDLSEKVSRGEFAAIALKLYDTISKSNTQPPSFCPFTDISGDPNEDAIKKAYGIEITQGVSDSTFEPSSSITREQLATMLCRVLKKYSYPQWSIENDALFSLDTSGAAVFSDDADISSWAKQSVYFLAKNGIVKGVDDTHFAPKNMNYEQESAGYASATREQAIIIAQRIFNNSELLK